MGYKLWNKEMILSVEAIVDFERVINKIPSGTVLIDGVLYKKPHVIITYINNSERVIYCDTNQEAINTMNLFTSSDLFRNF